MRGLHGIHGAMRVEVLTDRPDERFIVGRRLWPEGKADGLSIVEARPANPGWILRFREVTTREQAEAFRMAYLEVEAGPADALPRGAYFWHEMIGVTVRDLEGAELGTVRDVYRVGGGDVLEVVGGPRGDFDLPIVRPFVRILAPRRGEIVADPEALDLPAADRVRPVPAPRPPRPRRATRRRPAVPLATRPDAGPPDGQEAPAADAAGAPDAPEAAAGDGAHPPGDGAHPPGDGAHPPGDGAPPPGT